MWKRGVTAWHGIGLLFTRRLGGYQAELAARFLAGVQVSTRRRALIVACEMQQDIRRHTSTRDEARQ